MLWQLSLAALFGYIIWKILTIEVKYKDVPGPKRWPIVGSALSFFGYSHSELFQILIEFPKIYGHRYIIQVFNRYILHIYDVKDIETVLSHSKNIQKSKAYNFIVPWLSTGLLISTGSKWHRRRKILTPAFHFDILKNFTKVFVDHSRGLVKELRSQVQNGSNVVDLMPFVSDFTLYTICETAMGTQLHSGGSSLKVEYKKAILRIGHLILQRIVTVYLHNDFIYSMLPVGRRFKQNLQKVHTFADNVIIERKKQIGEKGFVPVDEAAGERRRFALLDLLLEAERKGEIDLEGIREEVNTFMFEGHDTTAIAITFGLMLIADHEEVQERMFEECTSIFGGSDRSPTMSDLSEMKYLEAVIKEILRLYPSVPFIGREIDEDMMLGDLHVKRGCEVIVHIYDVQRRADLFPDPEAFKPDRFLSGETRHPYAYVPFSAGLRNCIGQRFAKLEMKCFLSEVIRNFKLQPIKKGARPRIKADLVLRADEPVYVKFIPR